MKLTTKEFNDWLTGLAEYQKEHSSLRKGQNTFNYLHQEYPQIADKVRGTESDPFYNDNKLGAFYQWLMDEVVL